MTQSVSRECAFCGAEEMSNTVLRSDPTVEYMDGPPRASVPSTVLCYDCAQDVSDYLDARSESAPETPDGLAPFGEQDADALLDRLAANEHLVLERGRGSGYGIRVVDGTWKHAVFRAPGPPVIETLTRDEVRDLILDAKRVTLKHFDPSAWERFERES
jgi:hypothetical protein